MRDCFILCLFWCMYVPAPNSFLQTFIPGESETRRKVFLAQSGNHCVILLLSSWDPNANMPMPSQYYITRPFLVAFPYCIFSFNTVPFAQYSMNRQDVFRSIIETSQYTQKNAETIGCSDRGTYIKNPFLFEGAHFPTVS